MNRFRFFCLDAHTRGAARESRTRRGKDEEDVVGHLSRYIFLSWEVLRGETTTEFLIIGFHGLLLVFLTEIIRRAFRALTLARSLAFFLREILHFRNQIQFR